MRPLRKPDLYRRLVKVEGAVSQVHKQLDMEIERLIERIRSETERILKKRQTGSDFQITAEEQMYLDEAERLGIC